MSKQGCSGGRAQLPVDRTAVNGYAGEQVGSGRGRDGHHPVGAPYRAAAHMDGRDYDPFWREQIQGIAHPGDISHRIQGPHLVKVDIPH